MKNLLPALLFVFVTATAAADSFEGRVQRAKLVEASPEGQAFQKELWGAAGTHTANVMQQCFPAGAQADTESFTLVATLVPAGALSRVEVQPRTTMSLCFAKGFAKAPFPKPPEAFRPDGMPLVVEMKIKP